jgi:acyl-CoA dehydrogenase
MDFTLDEQQTDVRDLARGLIARRTAGEAAGAPQGSDWFDTHLWHDLAQAGLLGIAVSETSGGSGAGFVEQCLLVEEVARAAARVPVIEAVVLAALPISIFGTDEQRRRLVAPFCSGDLILGSAVRTEPVRTRAVTATYVDDAWRLTGAIGHVPLADVAERVVVEAVTEDDRRGWFLLDPRGDGVSLAAQSSVDRAARWHLSLSDAEVAAADVLLAPETGVTDLERWLDTHGVASRCIAAASSSDAALRMTAAHVTEREQFGRPVGTFQAVAHRVADAYIDATGVRLTAWRAAWLLAQDEPATEALAIAAWWATDAPTRIGDAAMHLHGGLSVDLDYPLHRHYLALRQIELSLGGSARRLALLGDRVALAS